MENDTRWIVDRIEALHRLLAQRDYRGYDPFDILNAPIFRRFPSSRSARFYLSRTGSRFMPDWIRSLLRVPSVEDPKTYACAYFGYAFLPEDRFGTFRTLMIERLCSMARASKEGRSWGYGFEWPTRADGINPQGASTIVPASFALFALIYERVVHRNTSLDHIIHEAVEYILSRHVRRGANGSFLGYFTGSDVNVHNANLLGCTAVNLAAIALNQPRWLVSTRACITASLQDVEKDGYMPYSDHETGNWTDAFHHLYVIGCLQVLRRTDQEAPATDIDTAVGKLVRYYEKHFIRPDGLLNYFPDNPYPIDCHNYAAALVHAIASPDSIRWKHPPERLGKEIDSRAWISSGKRYAHKIYRFRRDRRLFLRWNQAWMFAALSMVSNPDRVRERFALLLAPQSYRPRAQNQDSETGSQTLISR